MGTTSLIMHPCRGLGAFGATGPEPAFACENDRWEVDPTREGRNTRIS